MFLRVTASNLLKKLRFPSSRSFSFSEKIKLSRCYQTQDNGWRVLNHRDHFLWILLSGHVAMSLGISANTVFAEDATTGASSANDNGNGLIGLSKVEDGSIVSNMHTAKWRLFTDKAREFFLQGKLDEAEKLFLSALQEAKEGFGERDPHVASSSNNLAELYRIQRAFDKAEPLYLEAINILEESFGPDDIRVGTAAHNLGQFYLGQRKMEKARLSYERALKIKRRVLGYVHSECADTMYHLGVVLYLQGKESDAEALIQDSIKMLEEGDEGESTVCIRRLRYLSQMYLKSHRLADAEMVQRKILHIMELSKGWNSLDTVVAAESLALTLQASSNIKDSKELLERCLNARKALLPGDHIQIGGNLLHLAKVALLDCNQHKKLDVSRAKDDLDMAQDHLHNSIRKLQAKLDQAKKDSDNPAPEITISTEIRPVLAKANSGRPNTNPTSNVQAGMTGPTMTDLATGEDTPGPLAPRSGCLGSQAQKNGQHALHNSGTPGQQGQARHDGHQVGVTGTDTPGQRAGQYSPRQGSCSSAQQGSTSITHTPGQQQGNISPRLGNRQASVTHTPAQLPGQFSPRQGSRHPSTSAQKASITPAIGQMSAPGQLCASDQLGVPGRLCAPVQQCVPGQWHAPEQQQPEQLLIGHAQPPQLGASGQNSSQVPEAALVPENLRLCQVPDNMIPISDLYRQLPTSESEPIQIVDTDLDQVIIQTSQNMTNQAAAHDTRLLCKFWGDEVSEEEETFTPVVTKNPKKKVRNKNRQINKRIYNTRQSSFNNDHDLLDF